MAEKNKKKAKIPTICLDMDDCIVDFLAGLCLFHNKRYNTCVTPSDITDWNFDSLEVKDAMGNVVKGAELRKTFKDYEGEGLYAALRVLGAANLALELMKKLGYKIIILTAREEKFGKQTEINIAFNGLAQYVDEVYFLPLVAGLNAKVQKIQELSKTHHVAMFADDKASTVQEVSQKCSVDRVFLVDQTHNKNVELDEEIVRVRDLMDTVRYLKAVK